jgi:probable rRNA maturation factor
VITFDQNEGGCRLKGEIYICPEVAISQAKEFRTSWQQEVVRYAIHGLLHLQGHDDRSVAGRNKMKREEDRMVSDAAKHFAIPRLQRRARRSSPLRRAEVPRRQARRARLK